MTENVERKEKEIEVSVGDLLGLLVSKLWILILVAVVVGGGVFAYEFATYEEEYSSVTKLYVLNTENMEDASASSVSYYYSQALSIIEDCKSFLTEDTVIEKTIQELGLYNMTTGALRRKVEVTTNVDSRIIEVNVTTTDKELSRDISVSLCHNGEELINSLLSTNMIRVYQEGKVPAAPSNSIGKVIPIIAGVVAAALVYVIYVLCLMLNDKISTSDDVEKYLGLSTLGSIPNSRDGSKKEKYKYGKYVRYASRYGK